VDPVGAVFIQGIVFTVGIFIQKLSLIIIAYMTIAQGARLLEKQPPSGSFNLVFKAGDKFCLNFESSVPALLIILMGGILGAYAVLSSKTIQQDYQSVIAAQKKTEDHKEDKPVVVHPPVTLP